jgi:predicted CoA-substrate-specific enzyme activase
MITAGIDIGSVATKALILQGQTILARTVLPTGSQPGQTAQAVLTQALSQAGLGMSSLVRVVSTGYGRRVIEFGDRTITEILACSLGAHFLTPSARMAIDLGGQDTKVIRLDAAGKTVDFLMNDKCAAGTGRFLELLARALEVKVEDLGPLSLQARRQIPISATCAVFAESEVVSLLAQAIPKEDIIAGIHRSIAERMASLVFKLGVDENVLFCGGGAQNIGLKFALEQKLQINLVVPEAPQWVIALGAALEARKA